MVNIYEYTDYRAFLHDAYRERHGRNRLFSHRYIVRHLGHSSAAVFSHILAGRMNLKPDMVEKIAEIFELKPKEREYFELLVRFGQTRDSRERRKSLSELISYLRTAIRKTKPSQYQYYTRWYYSAVRGVLYYHPFDGDFAKLARLVDPPITVTEARRAIKLLEQLKLVVKDDNGGYTPADPVITTGEDAMSVALGSFQLQAMDLAKRALDHFPRKHRELSSLTLSISRQSYEQIRQEIRACRQRVMRIAQGDLQPDCVYQANFQVFPVSKVESAEGGGRE